MANEALSIEKRDDGVAIVRMDIPGEPMNTLKADFVDTFMDVFGQLESDTEIKAIERCSGRDGTYAVKKEYREVSKKIARPVARQVDQAEPDHFVSDCPMAAEQIASVAESATASHPIQLLRRAYGI